MTAAHSLFVTPFETLGFMRSALVACLALSLANGTVGTLLLLRRMSLDGDVLGAVMPGRRSATFMRPRQTGHFGGLASGLAVAVLAGAITRRGPRTTRGSSRSISSPFQWRAAGRPARQHVDLVRVLLAPCLQSIGRRSGRSPRQQRILLAVAAHRPLAVDAFDPAFLHAAGGWAGYRAAFSVLVVLALVASFQAFGTLLAVGPMLLPAAAARCWSLGAAASIALATAFGLASSVCGLLISYHGNLPSGPAIVLSAGMLFGLSLLAAGAWRRLAPLWGSRS
jgi:zinc/manganese transport system permease protein